MALALKLPEKEQCKLSKLFYSGATEAQLIFVYWAVVYHNEIILLNIM